MRPLWFVVLAGCSFQVGAGGQPPSDDTPPIDAAPDAEIDAFLIDVPPSACLGWNPHHFDPCMIPAPTMDVDMQMAGAWTLDTSTKTLTKPDNTSIALGPFSTIVNSALLVSVNSFRVRTGVTLRVIGSQPLIVASWDTIIVGGTIDAGSHLSIMDPGGAGALVTNISSGAGANPSACATHAATAGGNAVSGGSGGGGGGGYRGVGGTGGKGDTNGVIAPGVGGAAVSGPATVLGGCSGAISGTAGANASAPSNAATTTPGGPGGGAIQLTAKTSIAITGVITAGGAGGGGAQKGGAAGGGGAGSGGFIGLDSPMSTLMGAGSVLAANGGGGGTSAMFSGEKGHAGEDGKPSMIPAKGGVPDSSCSRTAPDGSAGANANGGSVPGGDTEDCGGAGGGGAAGFILVWGNFMKGTGAMSSPTEQTGPQ